MNKADQSKVCRQAAWSTESWRTDPWRIELWRTESWSTFRKTTSRYVYITVRNHLMEL